MASKKTKRGAHASTRAAAPGPSADLIARIERVLDAARREGRAEALAEVRLLVGGTGIVGAAVGAPASAPADGGAAPEKPAKAARRKPSTPRKNPWATMTPEQKADRVRKMLAGRGLEPKS